MAVSAGPGAAVFNETDSDGLGIDTSLIPGVNDAGGRASRSKFDLVDGTSPISGEGEAVVFSFNQAGMVRNILFEGLKDELLEYFQLTGPDGTVLTFFDAEIGLPVDPSIITEPNVTLLVDGDDDLNGLKIPFQSNEQFILRYSEFAAPGIAAGNGARWQGITVVIPEPERQFGHSFWRRVCCSDAGARLNRLFCRNA